MKTKQKQKQTSNISFHEKLVEAFNNTEASKFDLAIAMYECYNCLEENTQPAWVNLGYSSFKEYVQTEFGLEYRNALYYVKYGELIFIHGFSKEDLESIGWSKVKLLLPEITKGNLSHDTIKKLFKSIEKMTVNELRNFLLTKGKEEKQQDDTIKKTFKFTPDQFDVINTALTLAREQEHITSDSYALEIICAHYISSKE